MEEKVERKRRRPRRRRGRGVEGLVADLRLFRFSLLFFIPFFPFFFST